MGWNYYDLYTYLSSFQQTFPTPWSGIGRPVCVLENYTLKCLLYMPNCTIGLHLHLIPHGLSLSGQNVQVSILNMLPKKQKDHGEVFLTDSKFLLCSKNILNQLSVLSWFGCCNFKPVLQAWRLPSKNTSVCYFFIFLCRLESKTDSWETLAMCARCLLMELTSASENQNLSAPSSTVKSSMDWVSGIKWVSV